MPPRRNASRNATLQRRAIVGEHAVQIDLIMTKAMPVVAMTAAVPPQNCSAKGEGPIAHPSNR